jgi:2-isopropylmalate synthase
MLPSELVDVVGAVLQKDLRVGIHAHNDAACAVANSMAAIDVGATHVQGTANGYGERCGNADLFPIIANLELKRGRRVLPSGRLADLQRVSHAVAEVANIAPDSHQPYVGASAFAHKGGLHASAVKVDADLYQHIDPAAVGNERRMLVSKQGGRASLELWAAARGVDVSSEREAVGRVVDRVKSLEDEGWSFEAAEASLELLLREELEGHREVFFEVLSWRVIVERLVDGEVISEATVKLRVDGERVLAVGEGNGPVNALDRALRSALLSSFPDLAQMELVDYKVRIVEGALGTGAVTRVLVETSDGLGEWDTVGVHENVIAASWHALVDSLAYGLLRQKGRV